MKQYKCPTCEKEFDTPDEVINDIALHANDVPVAVKQAWFEGAPDPLQHKAPWITEAN